MYKELEKYKNGNIVKVEYEVGNGYVPLIFNEDEYLFKLGDLLIDFNKHLNKYFWQKTNYHNHLTQIYVKILNEISFKRSF